MEYWDYIELFNSPESILTPEEEYEEYLIDKYYPFIPFNDLSDRELDEIYQEVFGWIMCVMLLVYRWLVD